MTSKFNKRHKPIRTAAKTRRAIKAAIKRSPFSRPVGGGCTTLDRESKRQKEGVEAWLACMVVNRKVRRAGTH